MLCILDSSISEQFAIVNGGELIQIIHGLISLSIVTISPFSPNSLLDADAGALWKSPDLGQCQVVVNSVSDLEDITITNGEH